MMAPALPGGWHCTALHCSLQPMLPMQAHGTTSVQHCISTAVTDSYLRIEARQKWMELMAFGCQF